MSRDSFAGADHADPRKVSQVGDSGPSLCSAGLVREIIRDLRKKAAYAKNASERAKCREVKWMDLGKSQGLASAADYLQERFNRKPNTSMSGPEPICASSKDANPKGSLHAPVVLGMGSKTILPEGH